MIRAEALTEISLRFLGSSPMMCARCVCVFGVGIRLVPPLNTTEAEVAQCLDLLEQVANEVQ
jgi:4-aminobutyrate aminotransferase-like enzyme